MKVLVLAHSFPRSETDPVGSFVLRLAVALRAEGVEVLVIAPSSEGLAPEEQLEGIPVERFRYAPRRLETLAYTGTMSAQVRRSWTGRLAMIGFLGGQLAKAIALRRRFEPGLIHAHWWFPGGLVGTSLRSLWRVPVVTTLHGSDLRLVESSTWVRPLLRSVLRRSSVVTAVSQWLARVARALVPEIDPVVAPMPIVPELFQPGEQRAKDNRLLFVGKLNEQKGIKYLLRAMALMQTSASLDIVVGVGSVEDHARRFAAELGIENRLRWHPLLPQYALAELYRSATALVVPSIDEGFGLVALEAQLSETPVVAFDSGGLPDAVLNGRTGYLVPPRDAAALATALDQLLERPDRGAALGRAGRARSLATFAPDAVARRYKEIYQSALELSR